MYMYMCNQQSSVRSRLDRGLHAAQLIILTSTASTCCRMARVAMQVHLTYYRGHPESIKYWDCRSCVSIATFSFTKYMPISRCVEPA